MRHSHFMQPVTKMSVYQFTTLIDIVNGVIFNESKSGRVSGPSDLFRWTSADLSSIFQAFDRPTPFLDKFLETHAGMNMDDTEKHLSLKEIDNIISYWGPVFVILQHMYPNGRWSNPFLRMCYVY